MKTLGILFLAVLIIGGSMVLIWPSKPAIREETEPKVSCPACEAWLKQLIEKLEAENARLKQDLKDWNDDCLV